MSFRRPFSWSKKRRRLYQGSWLFPSRLSGLELHKFLLWQLYSRVVWVTWPDGRWFSLHCGETSVPVSVCGDLKRGQYKIQKDLDVVAKGLGFHGSAAC